MADKFALGWMAYWHNLVWKVQSTGYDENGQIKRGLVERLDNLMLDYQLKSAKVKTKKEDGEKVSVVDAVLESNAITFETTYKTASGTDNINNKLLEIRNMIGYAAPLVLANYSSPMVWGSFYMQLTGVSTSNVYMDEVGRITEATVQFTLEESQDKKLQKQAVTYPAGSTNEIIKAFVANGEIPDEFESALKISPDPDVKALIKAKSKSKKKKKK